jgi:chromosome segregation ATPase
VSDDLEYHLRDTDRRVRDLDSRLDDLDSDHQHLKTRFGYTDDLDHELRSIRSDVSDCESKIERVDDRVDEIEEDLGGRVGSAEQAVKRLTQHVRLLEGQIIAASAAPAADLDTFTKDQRALARTMQAGWNAADALLSDWARSNHQVQVARFRDTQARHQAARSEVIDLSSALAGSRYGTDAHAEAATQLSTAIATERSLRQHMARQAAGAQEAADALAADTATRADKQPTIAAGTRAEKRLTLALRGRVADAVSSRSLLPAWFATVLGSAPPARETDRWLECATGVLLYRLTYGIDDKVVALGPSPTVASQHRHRWHEDLSKDLRHW